VGGDLGGAAVCARAVPTRAHIRIPTVLRNVRLRTIATAIAHRADPRTPLVDARGSLRG